MEGRNLESENRFRWLFESAEVICPVCVRAGPARLLAKDFTGAFALYYETAERVTSSRTRANSAKEKSLRKCLEKCLRSCACLRKEQGARRLADALYQVLDAAKKQQWKVDEQTLQKESSPCASNGSETEYSETASKEKGTATPRDPSSPSVVSRRSRPHLRGGRALSSAGKSKTRARERRIAGARGWRGVFERLVIYSEKHNKRMIRHMRINPLIGNPW